MVVGTKNFTLSDVLDNAKSVNTLRIYADSLIPDFARHIPNIRDNQIYLITVVLRCATVIPIKDRIELCEELLSDITIKGQLNVVYDIQDIISRVNLSKLRRILNERRT